MVGDRWRDTEAGLAAGCRTIFVDYGHFQDGGHRPDHTVRSLPEAVSFILEYA
jgi:D-glycero-D-manno-heptose 1,7-bisphosphate phosphatase